MTPEEIQNDPRNKIVHLTSRVSRHRIAQHSVKRLYQFLRSGYWDGTCSRDFLTLHCWCHKRVWGYWPLRMDKNDMLDRCSEVYTFWRRMCHYDPYVMVTYIRWAWLREKRRKEVGKIDAPQLSSRCLFSHGGMMAEYKREMAEQAAEVRKQVRRAAKMAV
jgi:hypothetical protein